MKHRFLERLFLPALAALLTGLLPAPARAQMGYHWGHFAGFPGDPVGGDGTGIDARFFGPQGVAVDGAGNVYVADTGNDTIRKVTPAGVTTTLAGAYGEWGDADGTGPDARFDHPVDVAVDGDGNVYVADSWNYTIRKVTPAGVVTTLAGKAGEDGSADGTGAAARFSDLSGLAVDGAGNVYVVDWSDGQSSIRKVTPGGVVTLFASGFSSAVAVAVDGAGNVYVVDTDWNDGQSSIHKVTPGGVTTTFASGLLSAGAVAVDGAGNVYVVDVDWIDGQSSIRKVTPAGVRTTLADGFSEDIGGVAVDGAGNVYVADASSKTIHKVTPAGVVTTIGGTAWTSGNLDGAGAAARFRRPEGIAVVGDSLFVVDAESHRIVKGTLGVVPPSVTTLPASGVTTNSATAGGNVTADGGGTVTERGVVYSTSPNPAIGSGIQVAASGSGTGSFAVSLAGLSHTTTYYVRAYATGSAGTDYGPQVSFTTQTPGAVSPTVTTSAVSGVTTNSATVGGNVTADGGAAVTERGVVYSTSPSPAIGSGTQVASGGGTGSFAASLSGLSQNTTYYVRAYAINTSGTAYGSQVSFATPAITATPISNNVPLTGLSGVEGGTAYYVLSVPAGLASLTIQISGGPGDCDLYVRHGDFPTFGEWDHRPYEGGNNETVVIANPAAGSYYIMLYAFEAFSGVTLLASHAGPATAAAPALTMVQKPKGFPVTVVGKRSRSQTLRISNGGGSPLSGLHVSAKGKAKRDFLVTQPKLKTLAPGAATTIKVTFRPKAKGARKATLEVRGSAPTAKAPLSGRGKAKPKK